ncbi:MAG: UTP--glucose-1-phosphate uridylyltransferase, partial [Candidatus Cloacimonetes bacterium]|nr:UTP--glucose-1-phosphate uridylyltransferase [Candidatus Cloacimonadota bacterium]
MDVSFTKLMKSAGLSENLIRTFEAYYSKLERGETGKISKQDVSPPSPKNLVEYENIRSYRKKEILKHTVIIKLNGGLGTSMGLSKAKSLLPVKGNMNFLDIITRQVLALRSQTAYDIPLIFMNSFNTEQDTLSYLDKYPDLFKQEYPLSFVQNKFPRIRKNDLKPFEAHDPKAMWNPPGHGDLYTAISSSGLLDKLIDNGYRYAFVSNSDNLGATLDPAIPNYMQEQNISFLMEVCLRSSADKKGGHLGEDRDGRLLLREIA